MDEHQDKNQITTTKTKITKCQACHDEIKHSMCSNEAHTNNNINAGVFLFIFSSKIKSFKKQNKLKFHLFPHRNTSNPTTLETSICYKITKRKKEHHVKK